MRMSLALAACTIALTSCSVANEKANDDQEEAKAGSTVVLVTHGSFLLPDDLIAKFEKDSGLKLEIRPSGDGGELTNKLVLTQGNPIGDVAFGVDNTFASRALEADVFAETDVDLPEGAEDQQLDGDDDGRLAPIDQASVCVNVDTAWFAAKELAPPASFEDLVKPAYKGLFVAPGATTSSPGMAFLLATIGEYGDDWPAYWADLMANDTKLVKGWEDAYTVDFTAGNADGKGTRPIVVSYDTSPAFTVNDKGATSTAALLDTCFQQVEYAGVLENAENPAGGREVVEFLLSDEVQAALPDNMYVFPVADDVALPEAWAAHAKQPTEPLEVDPAEIADNRDEWLTEWTGVTTR